jgi:hypothetical protein
MAYSVWLMANSIESGTGGGTVYLVCLVCLVYLVRRSGKSVTRETAGRARPAGKVCFVYSVCLVY